MLFLSVVAATAAAPRDALSQEYVRRLRSPAIVKGLIGGESHNSYVIRARKGQIMTVKISWRHEVSSSGANHAEFFVGEKPDFDGGAQVEFGKERRNGREWIRLIPRSADYYIYVNAYPTARYTLTVALSNAHRRVRR